MPVLLCILENQEGFALQNNTITATLVRCALTVGLIVVFFTIFKGFANLLNAFLVPMTIYMGLKDANKAQSFTLFSAVVIAGLLLFSVQTFFILLYFTMALLLKKLMQNSASAIMAGLAITLLAAAGMFVAIRLTDIVFLTRMHTFYMAMVKGTELYYGLMLLVEGLVIGFGLAFGAKAIERRMPSANY